MARLYRTKKLNAARSALLSVLVQAKERKPVVRFALRPDPLADTAKKIRKILKKGRISFNEQKNDDGICFYGFVGYKDAIFDHFAFRIVVTLDRVSSHVTLPGHIPENARMGVLDFVTRLNWSCVWGGLKMDMYDGELTYEITVPYAAFKGGDIDFELERIMWIPVSTFNEIAIPLAKLMLGHTSPRAAFREWQLIGMKNSSTDQDVDGDDVDDDEDSDGIEDAGCVVAQDVQTPGQPTTSVPVKSTSKVTDKPDYAVDILNVKSAIPLEKIVVGAKRFQSGVCVGGLDAPRFSLLLSGPPGSGKTCFVRHLAHQIGAPLIEARGSDLISSLVGQTERNLAEKFKEATTKHAVLFLDEVDSLLWSRAAATHAWEASEVNELLGQLERASCIVIGATNYADHLDSAVLRRFTFKVTLDYSTDVGKELLFKRLFKLELNAKQRERLASIPNLCPGDFRTARESLFYVKEKPTADDYLAALEKESETKGVKESTRIGF